MSTHLFIANETTGKSIGRHELPAPSFASTIDVPAGHVGLFYEGENPDGVETDLVNGDIIFVPLAVDADLALTLARMSKSAAVKELRDRVEAAGVMVAGALIDTDADAQRKVSGLVLKAIVQGAAFSVDFRRGDDIVVTLNAADMIALGVLVSDHVEQSQYRKNALDSLINSAATLADLDDIDIHSGWPS